MTDFASPSPGCFIGTHASGAHAFCPPAARDVHGARRACRSHTANAPGNRRSSSPGTSQTDHARTHSPDTTETPDRAVGGDGDTSGATRRNAARPSLHGLDVVAHGRT